MTQQLQGCNLSVCYTLPPQVGFGQACVFHDIMQQRDNALIFCFHLLRNMQWMRDVWQPAFIVLASVCVKCKLDCMLYHWCMFSPSCAVILA